MRGACVEVDDGSVELREHLLQATDSTTTSEMNRHTVEGCGADEVIYAKIEEEDELRGVEPTFSRDVLFRNDSICSFEYCFH